jgi:glycosyltransferase involved in cell wall biosynthesis
LNLLITITAYPPSIGGAQIHTHQLVRCLADTNQVQVVSQWDENRTDWLLGTTLRAPGESRDYFQDGIPVHRLCLGIFEKIKTAPFSLSYYPLMGLAIPFLARNLEQHLANFGKSADLIHNVRIGREPLSFASLYFARKRGLPFIFTPLHHPSWSGWLYRYYHDLYRKADALIALTEVEKATLASFGVDEEKIHVTGIGPLLADQADGYRFRETYGLGNDPIVLFLGQKYAYKGVEVLLKSAQLVWRRFPETKFVFIGPRTLFSQKLFGEIRDRRIIEMGIVDLQTKTDALHACMILCVPSTQESFGGVYTEAWSFEKPVIGCSIPSVAEVISDGEDGLLTLQEPKEIAKHLISLLTDPNLAHRMGVAGKRKVDTSYNWSVLAKKTEEVYRKTLYG